MLPAASSSARDDTPREDHFVRFYGASWEDYERLLAIRGDKSAPRMTYLEGTLEIMSPSKDHERIKSFIARLLETWCIDQGMDFNPYGSWTLKEKPKERGVEPDECYVFGLEPRDAPHLAIEVEWTSGGLDKLDAYKQLGVEEVWWWRKGVITVFVTEGDGHAEARRSRILPDLDLDLLVSLVDRPSLLQAVREFRAALATKKG